MSTAARNIATDQPLTPPARIAVLNEDQLYLLKDVAWLLGGWETRTVTRRADSMQIASKKDPRNEHWRCYTGADVLRLADRFGTRDGAPLTHIDVAPGAPALPLDVMEQLGQLQDALEQFEQLKRDVSTLRGLVLHLAEQVGSGSSSTTGAPVERQPAVTRPLRRVDLLPPPAPAPAYHVRVEATSGDASFKTRRDAARWLIAHGVPNFGTPDHWRAAPGWRNIELTPEAVLMYMITNYNAANRRPLWDPYRCGKHDCICAELLAGDEYAPPIPFTAPVQPLVLPPTESNTSSFLDGGSSLLRTKFPDIVEEEAALARDQARVTHPLTLQQRLSGSEE